MWFLKMRLGDVLVSDNLDSFNAELVRLLMGSKVEEGVLPPPFNVLKFVDSVDGEIAGFRKQYDRLSEIAHPNWAGTTYLFSKRGSDGTARFGKHMRGADSVTKVGLANLSVSLMVCESSYKQISDGLPEFVRVCDARADELNKEAGSDE